MRARRGQQGKASDSKRSRGTHTAKGGNAWNRLLVIAGLSAAIAAGLPEISAAQTATCPELDSARQAYQAKLDALTLNDEDIRPSRVLAGARREEAPRSTQEAPRSTQEAPRGTQEAPRGVQQAPRGEQSVQQAPRSTQQAPRTAQPAASRAELEKAKGLIADDDASCRAGNTADAAKKATAALRLLK